MTVNDHTNKTVRSNSVYFKRSSRRRGQRGLRLRLVIAFGGNVPLAEIALQFVNGHPEASERYRRFKKWEQQNYQDYCSSLGIKPAAVTPPSSEGQSGL